MKTEALKPYVRPQIQRRGKLSLVSAVTPITLIIE
jgi:hypothetical protein